MVEKMKADSVWKISWSRSCAEVKGRNGRMQVRLVTAAPDSGMEPVEIEWASVIEEHEWQPG